MLPLGDHFEDGLSEDQLRNFDEAHCWSLKLKNTLGKQKSTSPPLLNHSLTNWYPLCQCMSSYLWIAWIKRLFPFCTSEVPSSLSAVWLCISSATGASYSLLKIEWHSDRQILAKFSSKDYFKDSAKLFQSVASGSSKLISWFLSSCHDTLDDLRFALN